MLNILCIVQTPVPSTEISIIRPFTYLQNEKAISWQLVKENGFSANMLQQVDVAVFHRNCHPNGLRVLNAVKTARIPVIYEIDDNFFDLPEELPIGQYMRNPYIMKTIEQFLQTANVVKVGSPELIPLISKYNRKTLYQPYAVDLNIIDSLPKPKNPHFTIGYAGTIHHNQDFRFIINPIQRLAKEYPHIHWDFIGCLPEGLKKLANVNFTPFIPNYTAFLQDLYKRNWQIALCPLLDLPHNRCKTDNKLREYGACQIAGVYSNIPPYSTNVQPDKTGILAANAEQEWYEAIKNLIHNDQLRSKIAVQARQWVETQRSLPVVAKEWIKLFELVLTK
ncbi:glycosyltransferase involved in cell wall biosynthesis [Hydrogenispora ethanolica]|uniref:Glycosyltransferase involved in cell wall biosynthesis n=1 Tax=Hydrogenispora ethanolica TaxID=1082276 RepID=A0A4R1RV32_HYDET|nr:glycosyltransferase [Hydrogenispora ethanolica]TCL69960.1 glycosyltransferase involved in cell wall biosynthesis [Hydrogenispora ethanolica]